MAKAEFEPYSFEPMRNSSNLEDKTSEVEEPRRGNTTGGAVVTFVKLGRTTKNGRNVFVARKSMKL